METISNFIVFEGCDGSGTTTQLQLLSNRMNADFKDKIPFSPSFEPTDDPIGKVIKNALDKENPLKLQAETLAMLFSANRNEHL